MAWGNQVVVTLTGVAVARAGFLAVQDAAIGREAEDLGDVGRGDGLPGGDLGVEVGCWLGFGARVGSTGGGGGDAAGGAGGDDGVAADAGDGQALGLQGADDLAGGLHGDVPALHHFALGRDPVALGQLTGGDLGAELPDDLHV